MPSLLFRESFADRPAFDIAVSHALLRQVASGALGPVRRLYRPGPTVAFGKLDRLAHGYEHARVAAAAHGFAPVLRIAGGHAAAYDAGSLVYEEIVPTASVAAGLQERFAAMTALLADALRAVGADARVGAIEGEYCAGAHSINVGGTVKVVGIAQRAVRGAALVSGSVVVEHGAAIRAVLVDVYAELGIAWAPSTAGGVSDLSPGVGVGDVESAVLAALGAREEAAIAPESLELAEEIPA